jgi:NAD(P)-dependent dehydrogenase (short-subunit alcohol dehydrogenase family)
MSLLASKVHGTGWGVYLLIPMSQSSLLVKEPLFHKNGSWEPPIGFYERRCTRFDLIAFPAAERVVRDPEDPLSSVSIEDFNHEMAVNATTPFFAAQEAVKGFRQLTDTASRTFIFTGNKLNVSARPGVLVFGMGKSAAAHLVRAASIAYEQQGFK